jgi:hypothetical protein
VTAAPERSEIDARAIRVIGARLTKCVLEIRPGVQPGAAPQLVAESTIFGIARQFPTLRQAIVTLSVSVFKNDPTAPFWIEVYYEGQFAVDTDDAAKGLQQYAHANAIAFLFPYVRETVSSLTVRAGFAPLMLPLLNAQALADADLQAKTAVKQ